MNSSALERFGTAGSAPGHIDLEDKNFFFEELKRYLSADIPLDGLTLLPGDCPAGGRS